MYQYGFRLLVARLKILHPPGSFRVSLAWVALLEGERMQKAYQGWVFEEGIRGHLLCIQHLWTEDEFQSRSRSLLTLWSAKVIRGTNKITTVRKTLLHSSPLQHAQRGLRDVMFRVRKIHKYTFLGRASLLIWHRLAVGTRKELGMSEELKVFEARTHLK